MNFPLLWARLGKTRAQFNGTFPLAVNPVLEEYGLPRLSEPNNDRVTEYELNMLENRMAAREAHQH